MCKMTRVLVVEPDNDLRDTLETALNDAGYTVAGVAEMDLARAALRVSEHSLVVLVGTCAAGQPASCLAGNAGCYPPHAYVMLSTSPQHVPDLQNPHTRHHVPILAAPFELDDLLATVSAAGERLERLPVAAETRLPCDIAS
jgi:DNA-binding NtrC family response regulator